MYTLYHSPGTCSLAVKAALSMTGAPYSTEEIDISKGEQHTAEFLKINPLGKVPVVAFEGHALTEGAAIMQYLASKYPDASLLPEAGTIEYAEALRWLNFLYATLHPHWARMFFPERYGADTNDVKQKAEAELHKLYSLVDRQLQNHHYVAGEQMTIGDLYLAVTLHWDGGMEKKLVSEHKHLAAFKKRIYDDKRVGMFYQDEFNVGMVCGAS